MARDAHCRAFLDHLDPPGPHHPQHGEAPMTPDAPSMGGVDRRRPAAVLGMARSGLAAARLLLERGYQVIALDRHPPPETLRRWDELAARGKARAVWGEHPLELIDEIGWLVRSPGVPQTTPFLAAARRRGIPVWSELELAWRHARGPILALTGTNGKSTATAWLAHVLSCAGRPAAPAGNIGRALGDAVDEEGEGTCLVVEVSSFQLEDCPTFRPQVGVVLNITPDHLDRYPSFAAYAETKWKLFAHQTAEDRAIVPVDLDPPHAPAAPVLRFGFEVAGDGVFACGGEMIWIAGGAERAIFDLGRLPLPGPHNQANAMAVAAAALAFGLPPEDLVAGLASFRALPHRMEPVDERNGVQWVNDSKATNVDALEVALQSYDAPVVLIAGGRDKGGDFTRLAELARRRVRRLVVLGEAAELIRRAWPGVAALAAGGLEEAVSLAASAARPGDVVLLSPGCASQDMFRDYEER
ncbi:MAG: UDP-N-acetylmuramoyl-L-alanine--D-glutamate ligase, partial [Candidatus Eisenbacteria bacterium]|nr:UDP-N-acetylmuramoyl-L-alanine--D-glutamate ligase [Candidatus Eisenbacteria bacterium]